MGQIPLEEESKGFRALRSVVNKFITRFGKISAYVSKLACENSSATRC